MLLLIIKNKTTTTTEPNWLEIHDFYSVVQLNGCSRSIEDHVKFCSRGNKHNFKIENKINFENITCKRNR